MKYFLRILLVSSACFVYTGQSRPAHHSVGHDSGAYSGYGSSGYHGPLAITQLLPNGHIADTPEVSAAKQSHYSAVQRAEEDAAAHRYSGAYGYVASRSLGTGYAPVGYNGPLAKPEILPAGYIADTPEVTAAKQLHSLAIRKAKADDAAHGYSGAGYGTFYGSGVGYDGASSLAYSGPLAYPKVLPSGLLADTNEVSAAKHAHLNAVAVTVREHSEKGTNKYYNS